MKVRIRASPTDWALWAPGSRNRIVNRVLRSARVMIADSGIAMATDLLTQHPRQADRIHERRRAQDLIDKVDKNLDGSTTVKLIVDDGPRDLSEVNPDQLLDLPKLEDPAP